MKHVLLATAALFVCGTAYAGQEHQPAPAAMPAAAPANTAISRAAALSASQSRASAVATGGQSRSSATGGQSSVTVNNTASTGGRGYGGGYSARGNTPDVVLPGVSGGHPCGLGGSAGGSGMSIGAAVGAMWPGRGCEVREKARLLYNMGDHRAAREAACLDDDLRRAMFSGGAPCAKDARGWASQ